MWHNARIQIDFGLRFEHSMNERMNELTSFHKRKGHLLFAIAQTVFVRFSLFNLIFALCSRDVELHKVNIEIRRWIGRMNYGNWKLKFAQITDENWTKLFGADLNKDQITDGYEIHMINKTVNLEWARPFYRSIIWNRIRFEVVSSWYNSVTREFESIKCRTYCWTLQSISIIQQQEFQEFSVFSQEICCPETSPELCTEGYEVWSWIKCFNFKFPLE